MKESILEKIYEAAGWVAASLFALMILGMGVMGASFVISSAQAADIPPKIVSHMLSNVYQIQAPNHTGTGYWINDRLILTNCHVATTTRGLDLRAVSQAHGSYYTVDMVLCDEEADLAILRSRSPNPDVQPIKLAKTSIPFGSEIFSAGHGLALPLSPKRGIVGTFYTRGRRAMVLAGSGPGDSGSPVWNAKGELVGVLNSGMATRQGVSLSERSFFIGLSVVTKYLTGLTERMNRAIGSEGH